MKRAAIYVRVSTTRQEDEGYSLEAQLEMCRAYATRHGIDVSTEYVEVQSASKHGRPRFAAMLTALRKGDGLGVIAQSTDRLTRNLEDAAALERTGAPVHLVQEGGHAPPGAMSRFWSRLKASMAALYSDRLSEEASKGLRAKAARGLWPTVAPVGYLNVSEHGQRVIVPDPDRAPLMRQLFQKCAAGESVAELARWAKAVGLRRKGTSTPLSRSRIGDLLAHRIYMGEVVWKGEVFAGQHTPIVTEAEWLAARDAIHGRRAKPRRGRSRPQRFHVFAGGTSCAGAAAPPSWGSTSGSATAGSTHTTVRAAARVTAPGATSAKKPSPPWSRTGCGTSTWTTTWPNCCASSSGTWWPTRPSTSGRSASACGPTCAGWRASSTAPWPPTRTDWPTRRSTCGPPTGCGRTGPKQSTAWPCWVSAGTSTATPPWA